MSGYGYMRQWSARHPRGVWVIFKIVEGYPELADESSWVWSRDCRSDDPEEGRPPADLRSKFEELVGRPEFVPHEAAPPRATQVVELIAAADGDDCAFDQPCRFGHRVDGHAVYCHNRGWLYAPRKCRRTWYTGGAVRDEDCPGYEPNEVCA